MTVLWPGILMITQRGARAWEHADPRKSDSPEVKKKKLVPLPSPTPNSAPKIGKKMPPRYLTRANKACLTALQIWDTELGPTFSGEVISPDVVVPTEIVDLLPDIIQAARACLAAYRHPGKLRGKTPAAGLMNLQYHLPTSGLRMSFNPPHH